MLVGISGLSDEGLLIASASRFLMLSSFYNIIQIKYVREGQVAGAADHLVHQPRHHPPLPPPLLIPTVHPPLLLPHRQVQKYPSPHPDYFPKIRIFFCLCYVALSASLLGYNIATDSYSDKAWYEYVLQGGGGECIDSLILIIQLGVLRL